MISSQFTSVGTVATEPGSHVFENGHFKCSFRLAVNERKRDRESGKWVDRSTSYYTVNVYRTLGEHAYASFAKGDRVFVTGKLQVKKWEKEDRSGINVEIEAVAVGHELMFGQSTYTRTSAEKQPAHQNARVLENSADFETVSIEDIREEVRGEHSGRAA